MKDNLERTLRDSSTSEWQKITCVLLISVRLFIRIPDGLVLRWWDVKRIFYKQTTQCREGKVLKQLSNILTPDKRNFVHITSCAASATKVPWTNHLNSSSFLALHKLQHDVMYYLITSLLTYHYRNSLIILNANYYY